MTDLSATDFRDPAVLLAGDVDYDMYARFRDALAAAPQTGLTVIELTTLGGDPEVARMMGEDVRFQSEVAPERRIVFLGKTAVYSAGATFMGFFARSNRFLTRGTRLMIHERKMDKTLTVNGPLTGCLASARALVSELEESIRIQNEGFDLIRAGSSVSAENLKQKASSNWYVEAQEEVDLGLVQAVI